MRRLSGIWSAEWDLVGLVEVIAAEHPLPFNTNRSVFEFACMAIASPRLIASRASLRCHPGDCLSPAASEVLGKLVPLDSSPSVSVLAC